jgi:hypothetical protein
MSVWDAGPDQAREYPLDRQHDESLPGYVFEVVLRMYFATLIGGFVGSLLALPLMLLTELLPLTRSLDAIHVLVAVCALTGIYAYGQVSADAALNVKSAPVPLWEPWPEDE